MWLSSFGRKRRFGVRHRSVRPVLESLESRLVPSSAQNVMQFYPVGDRLLPLAQIGQAVQAESQQVLLALGPDPLKTDFQLAQQVLLALGPDPLKTDFQHLMLTDMLIGGYKPLPYITRYEMQAAEMQAAGVAYGSAAIRQFMDYSSRILIPSKVPGNGAYGLGLFGGNGLGGGFVWVNPIDELAILGSRYFFGMFPVGSGGGLVGGFGPGGSGYGGGILFNRP
jgi:hypothetical protein